MKKIYISLLSIFAALSTNAQLTQSNHAPVPSYSYAMFHCDSINTDPGFSGANVVWDYSAIETYTDLVTSYTTDLASNPSYPNATVVIGSSQGTELYYDSTPNDLTLYGGNLSFGGFAASLEYTDVAVVAVYPMSLNTSTTSIVNGNINFNGQSGTFTGNSHVIADGSGTLILASGATATFSNVLRVVTSQTLDITMALASATLTMDNFDYYSIGTRHPLFSIQMVTADIFSPLLGSPVNITQTTVLRDKNIELAPPPTQTYVSVQKISANNFNLTVYPNPSSSYINFVTESPNAAQVAVYDITGKLVSLISFETGKAKLNVLEMNSGLYIYSVKSGNGQTLKTGKIAVNH